MRCMGYPTCSKSARCSDRNTNGIILCGEDNHSTCVVIKCEFSPLLISKSSKISNIFSSSVLRLLPVLVFFFSINCLLSQKVIFKLVYLFISNRAILIGDVQVTLVFGCIQTFFGLAQLSWGLAADPSLLPHTPPTAAHIFFKQTWFD